MEKVCSIEEQLSMVTLSATLRYITLFLSYSLGRKAFNQIDTCVSLINFDNSIYPIPIWLNIIYNSISFVHSLYIFFFLIVTQFYFQFLFFCSNKLPYEVAESRKTSQVSSILQSNCVIRSPLPCQNKQNISFWNVVKLL